MERDVDKEFRECWSQLGEENYRKYCKRPLRKFDHLKKIAMEYNVDFSKLRKLLVDQNLLVRHKKRYIKHLDNTGKWHIEKGYSPTDYALNKHPDIVKSTWKKGICWRVKYIESIINSNRDTVVEYRKENNE